LDALAVPSAGARSSRRDRTVWRQRISVTPDEARQLHHDALVIDTKFPATLSVPSDRVRALFDEERKRPGAYRQQVYARTKSAAVRELWNESEAKSAYHELWRSSGVTAGLVSTAHNQPDGEVAFPDSIRALGSEVYTPVLTSQGKIRIAVRAKDI